MFRQVLQQASFRGIKFNVIVSEEKVSATFVVHRFPGNFEKKSVPERIGSDPKFFPMQAVLLGESRHFTLDLLKKARERKAPGKLIHPSAGMLNAYLASISSVERIDKLGRIRLKLEFIEAPEEISKKNIFDKISSSLAAAKDLLDDAAARFIEAFSIVDMPAYLVAQSASLVYSVRQLINSENGAARLASAIRGFGKASEGLFNETKSLVAAPEKLAEDIVKNIREIEDSEKLAASIDKLPSSNNKILELNANALKTLIYSGLFLRSASQLVLKIEKKEPSLSKVNSHLESLEKILGLVSSVADYEGALALKTFYAQLKNWVLNEIPYLNKVDTRSIYEETPALILAWKLYGDLEHEAEIIRRKDADNPLKITGEVEVFHD